MASSRFPGKPLAPILGMPMVGHTYHRARMSELLDEVFVATCDEDVKSYIAGCNGAVVMTAASQPSAVDRTVEAVQKIEADIGRAVETVVLIQGDDPMVTPELIDRSIHFMHAATDAKILTLVRPITDVVEFNDPNIIKVITDISGNALYFSREPIPSLRKGVDDKTIPKFKHVAIILFDRDLLLEFAKAPRTPLEIAEEIDLIRALEHGFQVKIRESEEYTCNVDTPEALARVEEAMKDDPLLPHYL